MAAIITVNGKEFPCPVGGMEHIITDAVNNGRNANGEVIGERVGRTQEKLNNLEWKMIDAHTAHKILEAFSNFFVFVQYFSILRWQWVTIKMYPGDRTVKPYYNYVDGEPTLIESLKVNIIDCGIL